MPDGVAVLVQCTGSKRSGTHPARLLYDESDYFVKQREYARVHGDLWFVQSAKHGCLTPDAVISDYDLRADDLENPEEWGRLVAAGLDSRIPDDWTVKVLGGRAYADPVTPPLEAFGYEVHEPLRGLSIGERKRKLMELVNRSLGGDFGE